ncbi:MAG: ornithine carbamoyltransferase [Pseudomonadota bacterium]
MSPIQKNRSILPNEPMSSNDVGVVLAHARALRRAARAGTMQSLLRGKKLALLSEADNGDAVLFTRAATELGAHVAYIRPSLTELSTPENVQNTARMLGRLYDAVECQGMPSALVYQVRCDAGVPIYDGIATCHHPTAKLAEQLGGDAPMVENRRFVLQAVLLSTIT